MFVNMVEVKEATEHLCEIYGEENRERITRILFLGILAFHKEQEETPTTPARA